MSRFMRVVWLSVGFFFVGIGLLGVVIPGLPTTPFMILAASCFARSSQRFYNWVVSNRVFGAQVRRFREGHGLTLRGKIISTSATVIFVGIAILFGIPDHLWWIKVLTFVLGLIGVGYILKQPTDFRNHHH